MSPAFMKMEYWPDAMPIPLFMASNMPPSLSDTHRMSAPLKAFRKSAEPSLDAPSTTIHSISAEVCCRTLCDVAFRPSILL